jgi:hypothetical protein
MQWAALDAPPSTAGEAADKIILTGGDYVARIIAVERQREGELPPGKIISVARPLTP